MASRRALTTAAVTEQNVIPFINRELLPYVRQIAGAQPFTGSRSTMTASELQFLAILTQAGIAVDKTTP